MQDDEFGVLRTFLLSTEFEEVGALAFLNLCVLFAGPEGSVSEPWDCYTAFVGYSHMMSCVGASALLHSVDHSEASITLARELRTCP